MKRLFVPFLALATLFFLGSSVYAQGRGRPPVTPAGGASSTHGNSASAGGHGSSNAMASTNPGGVLDHNSHLASKLETLTGAANVDQLKADAAAFKTFGQYVAAAHVSKNLNIPGGFAALMCDMTTKTASAPNTPACTNTTKMSLGKAIQTLDPHADAKVEAKKATQQANDDLKDSGS